MGWIIAFIVFIVLEILTVNLVSIWFAIGALVAYIISFFTNSFIVEISSFLVASAIALFITKPLVKKFSNSSIDSLKLNINRIIGQVGVVTKPILKDLGGEVKVNGQFWMAILEDDEEIAKGSKVIVKGFKGVKLVVKNKEVDD